MQNCYYCLLTIDCVSSLLMNPADMRKAHPSLASTAFPKCSGKNSFVMSHRALLPHGYLGQVSDNTPRLVFVTPSETASHSKQVDGPTRHQC